jgi:hypothetical protein
MEMLRPIRKRVPIVSGRRRSVIFSHWKTRGEQEMSMSVPEAGLQRPFLFATRL